MAKIVSEQNHKVMYGKTEECIYIFEDEVYVLYLDCEKTVFLEKDMFIV